MGADSFIKSQMHRRPTYDEVIYDAILNPTDKIKLPDRMATQLRNTHQLTRFDEVDAPIDLAAEQDKITKQRLKTVTLEGMGVGPNETIALKRAEAHKATQTGGGTQTQHDQDQYSFLWRGRTSPEDTYQHHLLVGWGE